MSTIDTLTRQIVAETVPDPDGNLLVSIEFSSSRKTWQAKVNCASADHYQDQGAWPDRIVVHNLRSDKGVDFAAIELNGTRDESAEAVLTALLDFVRTETPVPWGMPA